MTSRRLFAVLLCAALLSGCLLAAAEEAGHDSHDHESPAPSPAPAAEEHAGEEHSDHDHEVAVSPSPAPDEHSEEEHADEHHEDHDHESTGEATATGEVVEEEEDSHAGHLHGGGSCDMSGEDQNYNLGLHIGSVFILLGVSLLGAFVPVILHISSKNQATQVIIRLGTYFGFGTVLSTAFIHMMLPAAEKLSSDCLPESWTGKYEAWAYLFVVIAILMMQLIDFLVESAFQYYNKRNIDLPLHGAMMHVHDSHSHLDKGGVSAAGEASGHGHSHSHSGAASNDGSVDEETGSGGMCPTHGDSCHTLLKQKADPSQVVGIYLMEAGIAFHSVLIGLALGVTGGNAFNTLLVALSFHQFFEGFAIGSAAVDSGLGAKKSFLMGLIYAVTTPTGIAIGIGVRETFNHNSTTALLVEGILDSFSTGILIYVVLVELINPMMTQSKWLRAQKWWLQMLSFLSLYTGAGIMAGIGKWV